MSFGADALTDAQKKAASKIVRRDPGDPDPATIGECFGGDIVEIPFLGVCEFGFFIGRRGVIKEGKRKRFVGVATGFVRLWPMSRNPPRKVISVPAWVPVRCVKRAP